MTSPTDALYGCFEEAFVFFNDTLFEGKLTPVLLSFDASKPRTLGYYSHERWVDSVGTQYSHQISLNPSRFAVDPVISVLSTLVHEMCHQYQHEHGEPSRPGYHNAEFADIMEERGLITTTPGGKRVGQKVSHKIVRGGPFYQACTELIQRKSFRLAWVDRFVGDPMSCRLIDPPDTAGQDTAADNGAPADATEAEPEGTKAPATSPTPEPASPPADPGAPEPDDNDLYGTLSDQDQAYHAMRDDDLDDEAARAMLSAMAATVMAPDGEPSALKPPEKRQSGSKPSSAGTRRKYVCEGCHSHVLGKRGLRLKCLTCDDLMPDQAELDDLLTCLAANGYPEPTGEYKNVLYKTLKRDGSRHELKQQMAAIGCDIDIDNPPSALPEAKPEKTKPPCSIPLPESPPPGMEKLVHRVEQWARTEKTIVVDPIVGEPGGDLALEEIAATDNGLKLRYRGGELIIDEPDTVRLGRGKISFSADGEAGQIVAS